MTRLKVVVLALIAAFSIATAHAQNEAFVGLWKDSISGTGEVRLIITSVAPNGQIEGKMEFPGQSYASTFGASPDREKKISRGVVNGSNLTIDTAPGGKYELKLEGGRLKGNYNRGAITAVVNFQKS